MASLRVEILGNALIPAKASSKKHKMVQLKFLGKGEYCRLAVDDLLKALKGKKGDTIFLQESFEQAGFE